MKHVARIDIFELTQGGFKAVVYVPENENVYIEVYADKVATFLIRVAKAVKTLLGWK